VERHREQGDGLLFSRGQELVDLARRRVPAHLAGESQEPVGGLAHRGDGHDEVEARLAGKGDPARHGPYVLGRRDRATAVFLDHDAQRDAPMPPTPLD
jgi:hypothetical protein